MNLQPLKPKLAMMVGAKYPKALSAFYKFQPFVEHHDSFERLLTVRKKYWIEKYQNCQLVNVSIKSFLSKCLSVPIPSDRDRRFQEGLTSRSERTHSDITEIPFFLSQELGGLGVIRQEEPNENTNNDGGDTFEDEPD